MQKWVIFMVLCLIGTSVSAQYRIWTDQKGHAIEAEFKGVDGVNVILCTREGKTFKLSPLKLSTDDQSYLKGKIPDDLFDPSKAGSVLDIEKPPRMNIKVTKSTNTIRTEWDWAEKDVTCRVMIIKESSQPYSRTMTASLYTIGRAKYDDYYVMLDVNEYKFDFNDSKEVEFSGEVSRVRYYKSYNYGIEYEGYVVVIKDEEGNEMAYDASGNDLGNSRGKLAQYKRDDVFDKHFEKKGQRSNSRYYY